MLPQDCPRVAGQTAEILVVSALEGTGPDLAASVSDGDLFVGRPGWSR